MNKSFPRVELPGLTDEERAIGAHLRDEMDWYARTKHGYLMALLRKQPLFTGSRKPRRKPTAHQRRIEVARTRSAYVRSQAAA